MSDPEGGWTKIQVGPSASISVHELTERELQRMPTGKSFLDARFPFIDIRKFGRDLSNLVKPLQDRASE